MRLIYLFRRFVFAQVLLGIVAFCMAEGNPGMLLVSGAIGALSWYVTEGPKGRPLPRWIINLASLLAVLWLLFDLYWQHWHVIVAMGHFMIWLQIILLYARKSNREYGQLLVLSLMQMIGASVLSVSMIYGALLAAYCALAMVTILLFQLKSASDRVLDANRDAAPAGAHVSRPKPVVGRGHRWHFRLMTIGVGLVCGAIAVVVFVLIPRTGDANLPGHVSNPATKPRVGFSQQVDLKSSPSPEGGKEPVLNLRVSLREHDMGGDVPYLLRGAALDHYHPGTQTWTRGRTVEDQDRTVDAGELGTSLAAIPPTAPQLEATITLRQFGYRTLFTVYPASYVSSPNIAQVEFNPIDQQLSSHESSAGAVMYAVRWPMYPPRDMPARYEAQFPHIERPPVDRSLTPYGPGPFAPAAPTEQPVKGYARDWSVQRDRVAGLARKVLARGGLSRDPDAEHDPNDEQIADALADFLSTEYRYTLSNPRTGDEQDPVIAFLFNHRQGHCELFASALAAMARSLGMQARVITGYRASEYNRIGGYYVVRRSNAHSWTEINVGPDRGWRVFDATPPQDVQAEHAVRRTWLTGVRELYEHLEFAWIKSIVAYDQRTRRAVLDNINRSIASASDDRESWFGKIVAYLSNLPRMWRSNQFGYTLAGVIVIAILVALGSLVRTLIVRRRRLAALQMTSMPRAARRGLTRKLRFYLTMLDMLERHGYVRPKWQSPYTFAQELARAQPLRFDPVVDLTEVFYEVRFGHRDMNPARQQSIRTHLKQLEHALSQRSA